MKRDPRVRSGCFTPSFLLGVKHFCAGLSDVLYKRTSKRRRKHGKISSRFYPAWLRTVPQRGGVSISKGRSVRGEKCPRRSGGVKRIDRSRFSKHAGNDHRRPIGGRLRPSQDHGVVGNLKLFLRKRRRKLGQGRWISSRSICRARA